MPNLYISDTHFDHARIIELCHRPFDNVDQMNEKMVENWNKKVTAKDTVYHLGDFAWKRDNFWKQQLYGNIIFLKGNHDKRGEPPYLEIEDSNYKLVLCHYPIVSWNGFHKGALHFYGHVHGEKLNYMPLDWRARAFDVGVECLDYTPQTIEDIIMRGQGVI